MVLAVIRKAPEVRGFFVVLKVLMPRRALEHESSFSLFPRKAQGIYDSHHVLVAGITFFNGLFRLIFPILPNFIG